MVVIYEGKKFRSVSNSDTGDVGSETIFDYHQKGDLVWAEYCGGAVVFGTLIAKCDADGVLDMRYQHLNTKGDLMTGVCRSVPSVLPDGSLSLHEKWQWTSGDRSSGESIIEEVL